MQREKLSTKEAFDFLDEMNESGIENVFRVREHLMDEYDLPKRVAQDILMSWLESRAH